MAFHSAQGWTLVMFFALFTGASLVDITGKRRRSEGARPPSQESTQQAALSPDVGWHGGGVVGATAAEVRAALDAAFREGFRQWRAGMNTSIGAAEAVRRLASPDHLAEVYAAMRAVVAVTPYGSQDCMLAATPVYVAQCLTSAVAVMSATEAGMFADTTTSTAAVLPSVFRDVAAFRSTVCAQLCPCMVWASGRVPVADQMQAAARPPPTIAKAAEPFLKHFGARVGVPAESDALQQRHHDLLEGLQTQVTPLIPSQPLSEEEGRTPSGRKVRYDPGAETLVIRGPDGRNEQALPLPSAADLVTVLTAASRTRGRDPARHGPRMPGMVAFAGDSMVRGLFAEVVGLLRRGPLYHDATTGMAVEAEATGTPSVHSRLLYVRFHDVDVYISNMLGFLETTPETNDKDVRRAFGIETEVMLVEVVAAAMTGNLTTTDVVRFLVEVARPLAREFGSQPECTLRFVARALRALCDAQAALCPVLVLTYEFDHLADRPLMSHMSAEAADAFLKLRSRIGIGREQLNTLPPEHVPVEDLIPISVHIYANGMHLPDNRTLVGRQLTRFLLPARGLTPATAPVFIQRLACGFVSRSYAVPIGLAFIRAERAARRGDATVPSPAAPQWSSRRRVLSVGGLNVEALLLANPDVIPSTYEMIRSLQKALLPAFLGPVTHTGNGTVPPQAQQGPPQLLTLHLPLRNNARDERVLLPPQLVPVTTATRDAITRLLHSVRTEDTSHVGDSGSVQFQLQTVERGRVVLRVLRRVGALVAALSGAALNATDRPDAFANGPVHHNTPPPLVFPIDAVTTETATLLEVIVGAGRLRADPPLTTAVVHSAFVYDAMLLQSIFPFSGADAIHVNTMLFTQRDASLHYATKNRLACALDDCGRRDLGSVEAVREAAAGMGAPSTPNNAAAAGYKAVHALFHNSYKLVMGHLHSAFLRTTPPRATVAEEDSDENRLAEARVLAAALQENRLAANTTTTLSPIALAGFFNERFPVDMLVGGGCDRMMLGYARMLPGPAIRWHTTSLAARINARLQLDGTSDQRKKQKKTNSNTNKKKKKHQAPPLLYEQTPICGHTMYFSHSIGGRNPMQRLELALLHAHLAGILSTTL